MNISTFGSGASIFYTTGGVTANLNEDYTVTNGGAASTAVLVGANGSTVKIDTGKTLTTNTNVGLIATKAGGTASTAKNYGNIVSTRDSGIGIYTTESTGNSTGTITMQNKESVGILGENNSTLTNSGKIELQKDKSAGIYGKDSDVTNSGTGTKGIYVKDEKSAGIYGLLTSTASADKTLSNTGLVKVENAGKSGSAGIYAKLDTTAAKKLSTVNSGTIEIAQTGSAGIYAENGSAQANTQSDVTNSGLVKMTGGSSVGIIGEKSQITNSGTGTGKGIEIYGTGSAGILANNDSKVINTGRIEGSTGTSLVGISIDKTSTATNSGTITMNTASSSGISTKGGDVTNSGAITLVGTSSTGISSENANVTNSATTGEIIVKNANSMGIYSKSDGTVARTVSNAGEITLETPTGVSANKSAAIYSLLDAGSNKLTTTNTGTINVGQEGSAGIYAKNNTGTNTNSVVENKLAINVTKQGSAAILGEKSDITNSKTKGVITLSAFKSAGIIGNNDSKVSNAGKIETTGVSLTKAEEGLVGISLNASTGTNETTGTISLGTDFSTGIYGEASSTLTNAGSITGDKQKAVGMAAKASTATNNKGATITLSGANSTGMFGLAVGSTKSTLTNSGTINGNGEGAVGIAVNDSTAINSKNATINLTANKSTGMFGEVSSTVTNAGKIETSTANPTTTEEGLVGIAVNASTATNETTGQIILGTAFSTGMFGENNGSTKSTITNKGSITGNKEKSVGMAVKGSTATNNSGATITLNGTNSTGMFGEANGTVKSDVTNSGTITGIGEGTVGVAVIGSEATNSNGATISLQAKKSTGMFGKTNSTIKNAGKIETSTANPTTTEEGLVGIVLDNSTGTNESTGVINLGTAYSTGMFGENNSILTNAGNITGTADNAVGMAAKGSNATNNATITLNGANSKGMFGEANGTTKSNVVNNGTIKGVNGSTVGMAVDGSKATNNSGKSIVLEGKGSTGIFGKAGSTVSNAGTIETKIVAPATQPTSSKEGLVGIALNASTGTNTSTGEIKLGTAHSTGIFGEASSTIENAGKITGAKDIAGIVGIASDKSTVANNSGATITLQGIKSTGIFGKAGSTVSNAGTIETKTAVPSNSTEGLVGIALNASTGTNETSGEIKLGTAHSTGMFGEASSTLTNAGKITGAKDIAGIVGIASDKSTVTNNSGATITLQGKSSTGIFGKAGSTVSNAGTIETVAPTAQPTSSTEGLVGIALNASTGTNETTGEIKLGTAHSTGMFGEASSTLTNAGKITGAKDIAGIVGIASDKSTVANNSGATITLQGIKSTGIFGKAGSTVSNAGTIETVAPTTQPTSSTEGLVGIALNASTGTNTSNGVINLGTAYSTGMFGAAGSTVINEAKITGNQLKNVGMAGNASTVTNKNIITLEGKSSTGIFGENNSTLLNDTTGKITVKEEASVGIFSKSNNNKAENKGTISTEKKKSAGMFGSKGELENTNSITTTEEESAGMYVEHSNAINKKTILIKGKASAGIYAKLSDATGGIASGTNEGTDAVITMKKEGSAGMLGEVKSTVTAASTLTLTNSGNININSKNSTGMMLTNDSASLSKDKVKAENTGIITLDSTTATDNKNIGILANKKAKGINSGTINVNTLESVGMLGQAASSVENKKTINLSAEEGIGMLAKDTDSTATNEDTINVNGKQSSGMLAEIAGKAENKKSIIVTAESGVGIFVSDTGKGTNASGAEITLENKNAVGIFAKNNGTTHTAENAGNIVLGKADGSTVHESLIAMFAQAETGKTASVKNTGTIDINTKKSVGMYAKNEATNVGDVDLQNTETINVNNTGSAGIYAPKANISKVGKINLKDSDITNGSSAVYISKGGKVSDTSSADINLGKVNQNRVAYYVNGENSSLAGANIGKISGYGVGVYLQGNSKTDVAKIDTNTPTLDYTSGDDKGNGIIGLYLNGNTDIQAYTQGIKVGDSVGTKYAIGIYANKQGTPGGTTYNIATPIKTGANGVGIYADNDSNITYTGNMEVGDGTTAGTGIFITKKVGTNGGEVTLGSNTITLNGTGGVAVIASENTKFDGGKATINLTGTATDIKGIGVYAKKGSKVDVSTWTFNNNGHFAEEIRSEEGGAYITADKQIKPRMVLSHVINGETSVSSGVTVSTVKDTVINMNPKENIGLMAEGIKNPNLSWQNSNFEAVNHGTIDFSNSEKSTAMFINSARAQNDGVIKVGKNSTAIYGVYKDKYYEEEKDEHGNTNLVLKQTRKYDGASTNPDPNILKIETTANSKISLGDSSTGMYLINAETVNNIGGEITSETGSTKNVGIYAVNGQDKDAANNKTLTMTTATNIKLGNGSVGLYSKGQSYTVRNTVTNTGNIEVGDKIAGSPSVAMYAENTNLNTDSKIKVGNDGIAFYGKNSDITAKGTVNFSNNGVLAYLENSKFISHLGNLGATKNTMMYLKNSIAQLDGAGAKVDIEVADGYTGAYIEGNSQLTGVKTIKLGENSTGLYLQETTPNFVSTVETITGTKDRARGISAINSNFTNNSKISLSGEESVALYAKNDSATSKYIVNNGELNLSGKRTLGAFLRGDQTFENKANINIAGSADSKNPTIGIYTKTTTEDIKDKAGNVIGTRILEGSNIKHTSGIIEVGEKSIGIYSKTSANVDIDGGKIHVKDQGIGIYKEAGKLTIKGELDIDPHVATAKDSEPTAVYAVNGTQVDDQASKISVGEKSYGFILNNNDPTKTNTYINGNTGTVSMGNDSVFLYSNGKANIVNNRTINSNGSEHLIAFYIKNGGDFTNNGTIDFSSGKGNIGVYAPGGKASNRGNIFVGKTDDIDPATGKVYSDVSKIVYGIGMAADNGGHIVNDGTIRIYNNKSIGMYGSGVGTVVENGVNGKILLDGSRATATDKIQSMTGVYVDEGATFRNFGTITTTDSYAGRDGKINENVSGLTGVAVMNGSTLINEASGKILIDADNSSGVVIRGKRDASGNLVRNAVIKNYGEIKVRGKGATAISWKDVSAEDIANLQKMINDKITSDPNGREIGQAAGTNKDFQGVSITVQDGKPVFRRNGRIIDDVAEVEKINELIGSAPNLAMSDVGFYVDTLGRTRPVEFEGANPPVNSQLIIGTEYSERTNKKEWFVSGNVIKPFLDQIQGRNFKLTTLAGSLTWIATPVLDNYGQITGVAMSKLSYTSFVKREDNVYNFTDGLEQRYNMNALDSVEKRIFNKLNSIGKNEEVLLTQAFDEMMGHQYANVQQRVQATGMILDKEFSHLRGSWSNPTKDSNKIKTFGMKGEYKTDTAGVLDYKNNAYGVAYVHENEDIKLGKGTGWYTGIVHNTFKFKDIGNSKEEQLQAKVGLFKSVPFDENNSLNWTISGDIFVGHNKLERKFLVVDEIFHAKSKYYTYGIGIKNEIGKEFRLSEGFSVRPYAALKAEYGRVSKIKEKSGEMKLEVKENDYLSIRPEIGTELAYKHYFGTKSLTASVGLAYENELGRVANGKNKARVAGTTADWFNIRGEKEDRKGNIKVDLNVGLDNQRFGVTGNVGYDTKGSNVRGGVGLRVIF
ncbi:autotransporter adhesin [Fusobacterium polymorphum]